MTGKLFFILSAVFFILWIVTTSGSQVPFFGKLGHLPGDIQIQRDNFSLYLPIGSSILVSVVLTFLLRLFSRF